LATKHHEVYILLQNYHDIPLSGSILHHFPLWHHSTVCYANSVVP